MQLDFFGKPIVKVQFPRAFYCACGKLANFGKNVNPQQAIKKDDPKYLGEWYCRNCYKSKARVDQYERK